MSKRFLLPAATLGVLMALLVASPASAEKPSDPPGQFCKGMANSPDLPQSPPTKGGCASTLASVGNFFESFPSTSLAIANCKDLEAADFLEEGEPNPGGPYPYQFYWFLGSDPETFTAQNRADCLRLIEAFHSGELSPFPA